MLLFAFPAAVFLRPGLETTTGLMACFDVSFELFAGSSVVLVLANDFDKLVLLDFILGDKTPLFELATILFAVEVVVFELTYYAVAFLS